jgi:LmbE family N-acetylglucosaminyl deacetylase
VFAYEPEHWPRIGHRDHRVSGEIAREAMKKSGFAGWSLYYHTLAPNTFADVGLEWADAQALLAIHASQFNGERLRLIRGIVGSHAQDAGLRFGTDFAEEFRAVKWDE